VYKWTTTGFDEYLDILVGCNNGLWTEVMIVHIPPCAGHPVMLWIQQRLCGQPILAQKICR
jgi:hypothetical protein